MTWRSTFWEKLDWQHPYVQEADFDSFRHLRRIKTTIANNPLLQAIYASWYLEFQRPLRDTEPLGGLCVEIGSGAGHIEHYFPQVVKTDCIDNPWIQRIEDAQNLSFQNKTLGCVLMLGVLHHLSHPSKFFQEMSRTLKTDGRLVMIEPGPSWLHGWLTNRFNPHEYFCKKQQHWESPQATRMTMNNNAIPSIIFIRDRALFERQFPDLKIISIRYLTPLLYYFSGGLSYKQIAPRWMLAPLMALDRLLLRLFPTSGSMMRIEIKKVLK